MRLLISLLATLAALLTQQAFAAEPLAATLEAHLVVAANGKERFAAASAAKPGDVLEYRATYKNVSKAPLRAVMATLPVPAAGVEYLSNSAMPAGPVEASLDGLQFAPVPLKRLVKTPDGKQQQQLVPAAEYRFLRWPLGDLPAGASKTVSARVRVIDGATLTAAQP